MTKKNKFHKSNCDSSVKATVINYAGQTISLVGTYAHEYSVIIEDCNNTRIFTFGNRIDATKEFRRLSK